MNVSTVDQSCEHGTIGKLKNSPARLCQAMMHRVVVTMSCTVMKARTMMMLFTSMHA